jgi:hypothetical protein
VIFASQEEPCTRRTIIDPSSLYHSPEMSTQPPNVTNHISKSVVVRSWIPAPNMLMPWSATWGRPARLRGQRPRRENENRARPHARSPAASHGAGSLRGPMRGGLATERNSS